MFLHEGPVYHCDEDGWVAACCCGWETETFPSMGQAKKSFNNEHFLAGVEHSPTYNSWYSANSCSFCGHDGHTVKNCSRRPIMAFA